MQHCKSLNRLDWKVIHFWYPSVPPAFQQADLILVVITVLLAGKGTHARSARTCDAAGKYISLSFRKKEPDTPLYLQVI